MVKRIYVEKKEKYAVEADGILNDIITALQIMGVMKVRIINRYDVEGMDEQDFEKAVDTIFSEPAVDNVYRDLPPVRHTEQLFAVEYLPGQFDQRADSCAQCIQIMTQKDRPKVRTAKIYILTGYLDESEFTTIKNYLINPVESCECDLDMPETLEEKFKTPWGVPTLGGFCELSEDELADLLDNAGLSMDIDDLKFTQKYFRDEEQRDPTMTEIRVLDTYWSDHCRHTTFST
jgi:phosphoribosylformylglycinamidine synthase